MSVMIEDQKDFGDAICAGFILLFGPKRSELVRRPKWMRPGLKYNYTIRVDRELVQKMLDSHFIGQITEHGDPPPDKRKRLEGWKLGWREIGTPAPTRKPCLLPNGAMMTLEWWAGFIAGLVFGGVLVFVLLEWRIVRQQKWFAVISLAAIKLYEADLAAEPLWKTSNLQHNLFELIESYRRDMRRSKKEGVMEEVSNEQKKDS